jgi:hypothetical protein
LSRVVVEERVLLKGFLLAFEEIIEKIIASAYPELSHVEDDIFVECDYGWTSDQEGINTNVNFELTQDHFGYSLVTPGAMNQQQLFKEAELGDRDICRSRSLQSLSIP